jgi:hypothetical protein
MKETKEPKVIGDALDNLAKLPKRCFGRSGSVVVSITAGEMGYRRITHQEWPNMVATKKGITLEEFIDELNSYDGVTKAQRQAMEFGSMWGWGLKLADPDLYNENGVLIHEKMKQKP